MNDMIYFFPYFKCEFLAHNTPIKPKNVFIYYVLYQECEFIDHIYHIKHHKNSIIMKKSQEWVSIYVGVGCKLFFL